MTSGAPTGTSGAGWVVLLRAYAVIAGLVSLAAAINVSTQLDDARRLGRAVSVRELATWEFSSAVAALGASVVIYWAVRLAPIQRGRLAFAFGVHAGASVLFSLAHVSAMVLIRMALYAAAGYRYRFGLAEWPYEYRKDLIAYIGLGGVLWTAMRLARGAAPPAPATAADPPPAATFDIQDGGSILRVPVREILAVRAAGNYVEFVLEDARRPLMRASMARIEAALSPLGLVRTHRSWLVNAERVRALCPAGSGDFRLDLGGDLAVPLSRRYPAALSRLRAAEPGR